MNQLDKHIQFTAAICCKRQTPACELTAEVINPDNAAQYFHNKGWRIIDGVVTCPSCRMSEGK